MKYRTKIGDIEAFQLFIDPMPDWFMDLVTDNGVILNSPRTAQLVGAKFSYVAGDYLFLLEDGMMEHLPAKIFEHFCDPKPVNQFEPEFQGEWVPVDDTERNIQPLPKRVKEWGSFFNKWALSSEKIEELTSSTKEDDELTEQVVEEAQDRKGFLGFTTST